MVFMMGVYPGQKIFDFTQTEICKSCHKYGRYEVYMTYMQLLLFFIPCFRWRKEYYVRMTCCGTIYRLDPEVGARIARGEDVTIRDSDLTWAEDQNYDPNGFESRFHGGYHAGYDDFYQDYDYETDFGRDSHAGGRHLNGSRTGSTSGSGSRTGKSTGADPAQDGPRVSKHCAYCGYETDEDFKYCPKCGRVFF